MVIKHYYMLYKIHTKITRFWEMYHQRSVNSSFYLFFFLFFIFSSWSKMITVYWAGIMDSLHPPLSLCLENSPRLCFLHFTAEAIQLGHQARLKLGSLRCTGDNLLRWPVLLNWKSFLLIWEHNGTSWPFGPCFLLIKVGKHFFPWAASWNRKAVS